MCAGFNVMCFKCNCLSLSAPDENPSEVKAMGTDHNNLVISWKVILNHTYITIEIKMMF